MRAGVNINFQQESAVTVKLQL